VLLNAELSDVSRT